MSNTDLYSFHGLGLSVLRERVSELCITMSVQTSTFGAVRLSGKDAKKFRDQVTYGRPKKAAKDTVAQGEVLVREYNQKGYLTITIKK